MKYLRLSVGAILCLALVSGCSSSSTSGGSNTPGSTSSQARKSPDDEVRELIAKAKSMSAKERKELGPAMGARVMELRSQVSEQTRKEIDEVMALSVTESSEARSPTASGKTTRIDVEPEPNLTKEDPGLDPNLPVELNIGQPERAPPPRQVK